MALVVEQPIATFDLSEIARGDLVYGKHRTWPEGKAGFVTSATEKELIVQYHPGIGNVTNHFRIPIDEAVDAQWEIRYSHDMSEVKTYGIETLEVVYSGDGVENVRDAVLTMREKKPDMILCTGGMSVDPDDNTPGGIKAAGADIIAYGAPVLPGAMFLLGYFDDGMPVMGLPGCVMYAGATVFDLVLPKIAADVPVTRADLAALGEGGLCLGCKPCHYPICPFGK